MTLVALQTLALYSLIAGTPKAASEKKTDAHAEAAKPKVDAGSGLTPLDQSESKADIEITQRIRQEMMKDDRLSFTAKNVKIITRGGVVTLRGAVASNTEREAICALSAKVAGVTRVSDQLELPAAKTNPSN